MKYSDKLNGYWEEGYHYYLEFRDNELTVRDYRRAICLKTEVTYDANSLESGEKTLISLADNVLSRDYKGGMMTEIRELAYENGKLLMLYYYTIMGETLYTLNKVENGPFDHILIRDGEFLEKLQGRWEQWTSSGKGTPLTIEGNSFRWIDDRPHRFHAVSYKYDSDRVYLVPENLIDGDFGICTKIEVLPDMLTTTMMVCDMSMPTSVFARAGMLDKIDVPASAKRQAVNSMIYNPNPVCVIDEASTPMTGFMGMQIGINIEQISKTKDDVSVEEGVTPKFCPNCGFKLDGKPIKFCPECGWSLKI